MTDYKKLSENAFNIQAKTYDTDKNGKHARNLYQDIIKALSSLQFSNVLDVGCGTGEVLSIIRKLYPTALLYGIDISEEMLKKAEEKKIDNLNLYLGDAEHLPFENARFDVLICTDCFHHYPKPQKAVSEFYRVLDNANSHFPRPAGPHFPASQGHIKRSALEIGRARGAPPC